MAAPPDVKGFADGIDQDAVGLRAFCGEPGRPRPRTELIVCSSFSKNFGLYCERGGALTIVAADKKAADTVQSQIKATIRANYSNPPAHGAESRGGDGRYDIFIADWTE
jgi:aspartate aminotransferase